MFLSGSCCGGRLRFPCLSTIRSSCTASLDHGRGWLELLCAGTAFGTWSTSRATCRSGSAQVFAKKPDHRELPEGHALAEFLEPVEDHRNIDNFVAAFGDRSGHQ